MILNKILLLSNIIFAISCSDNPTGKSLFGEYRSKTYTYMEKVIFSLNKETYVLHAVMILKQDSSYIYTTCGSEMKGKWSVKNDSLLLKCEENNFLNDSINKIRRPSCGEKPLKFVIDYKSNELKEAFFSNDKKINNNFEKIN